MTLLGEVEKTDKEEVYINLRIDNGKKGTYPYPFRPETGNMLYNMPQKGTTVSLYIPNHDERFAMIINSIRQNTSQDMTDPSKRTFTTEHGKKLDLYKDQMKLKSKTTGTKVGLADEDTIFIKSHKNINIIAKEEILLKAKVININAKEELNLIKGDIQSGIVESSITESIEIDTKAKDKTQITGTKVENYAAIEEPLPVQEEEPKEEKFDWKKLGKNVLAGVAVVGAVALTLAIFGAAGPVVIGALVGGGLALGMTAVGDVARGKVSSQKEYAFTAFSGAVTGAISCRIDASSLKEGSKLVAEAASGFIIGTGEGAARQAFVEGKKEVNLGQSVMKGIKNAVLAVAVPLIIKGGQAVVNKIKTPKVNTVVGKVAEKGSKSVVNNTGERIYEGLEGADKSYLSRETEEKILCGERIQGKNKIIGGHSQNIINDANPNYAVEVLKENSDGTKFVQFYHQFPDGTISKLKKSTMFPDSWSDEKIISSIRQIGDMPAVGNRTTNGITTTLHNGTVDGVEIDVIKEYDKITAGYPVGGKPTPGFDPKN